MNVKTAAYVALGWLTYRVGKRMAMRKVRGTLGTLRGG
jgi:hypothetical protein